MTQSTKDNFTILSELFSQFAFSEWRTFDKPTLSPEYVASCLTDGILEINADQNICIDWNTVDEDGKTLAFYMLKEYPKPIMVDALILLGVDLHQTDTLGNTLLHEVCGCREIIRGGFAHHGDKVGVCITKLCEQLDINARNHCGETPIFMLKYTEDVLVNPPSSDLRAAIDAMIECGADIVAQDNLSRYFTDFAKIGSPPIAGILETERRRIQQHMLNTVAHTVANCAQTKGRKI